MSSGQSSLYTQPASFWTANIPTAMMNTAITVTLLVERELLALDIMLGKLVANLNYGLSSLN